MSQEIVFYTIDIESNGLLTKVHEIVEISIVRCSDKTQISRVIKADKPMNSSVDALRITGKTIQDLYQGISKISAIDDVDKFFCSDKLTPAHRCLIGHNVSFDRRFLHCLWEQYERSFPADLWIDTLALCKRLLKKKGVGKTSLKLDAALDLFGIKKVGVSHTAKGDSRNTYLLWKYLMDQKIDYLDMIKQFPHRNAADPEEQNLEDIF